MQTQAGSVRSRTRAALCSYTRVVACVRLRVAQSPPRHWMACVESIDTLVVLPFDTPPSHANTSGECSLAYPCCALFVHTRCRMRSAEGGTIASSTLDGVRGIVRHTAGESLRHSSEPCKHTRGVSSLAYPC